MSIQSELTRIQTAKSGLATAIAAKGVTVPTTAKLDAYPALVNSISTGITPAGTISITSNGTVDVTNYASANVNVSGGGGSTATLSVQVTAGLGQCVVTDSDGVAYVYDNLGNGSGGTITVPMGSLVVATGTSTSLSINPPNASGLTAIGYAMPYRCYIYYVSSSTASITVKKYVSPDP